MATLTPRRTVPEVPYITSPGRRVRAFVTDLGTFEKDPEGRFVLTAVAAGEDDVTARVEAVRAACGWDLAVAPRLVELPPPDPADIEALRRWDPQGLFLRGG